MREERRPGFRVRKGESNRNATRFSVRGGRRRGDRLGLAARQRSRRRDLDSKIVPKTRLQRRLLRPKSDRRRKRDDRQRDNQILKERRFRNARPKSTRRRAPFAVAESRSPDRRPTARAVAALFRTEKPSRRERRSRRFGAPNRFFRFFAPSFFSQFFAFPVVDVLFGAFVF